MVKVKHLKSYIGKAGPRPILYCFCCGSEYSADAGDYFLCPPEEILKCCDLDLELVYKRTVYEKAHN